MAAREGSLRLLVTDAHTRAALGAVRSLGRAGHTVIAAYSEGSRRPPSVWSRYCHSELRCPDPWANQAAFSSWLLDTAHGGLVDGVLPVAEGSLVAVAAVRRQLAQGVLPLVPPDAALEYSLSKFKSTEMARTLGIPCPETVFVCSSSPDWKDQVAKMQFPVIVKSDNYFTAEGGYQSGRHFITRSPEETCRIVQDLEPLGTRIIVQELIRGSGMGAFVLRFRGTTHLAFAHRRLHEVPYTGGWSSFRESCRADELVAVSERLLDAMHFDGAAMVEFRCRSTDGRPHFLEVNGRLWGSLALALHCGVDFPAALVECYRYGAPRSERRGYRAGVKCLNVFPGEVGHVVSILNAKPAAAGDAVPSKAGALAKFVALCLDPRIRHDYFWWSDPMPAIRQAAELFTLLRRKLVEKARRRFLAGRDIRMLEGLRGEHRARCARGRYFEHPLERIMFLCHGNICRSAFAEAYWNTKVREFSERMPTAVSSGVHPASGRRTPGWLAEVATSHGVDLTAHRSRRITERDAQSADAIFVMDGANYRAIVAEWPWVKEKTYFLGMFAEHGPSEIDDPYGKDEASGRRCCQELVAAIDSLMKHLSR